MINLRNKTSAILKFSRYGAVHAMQCATVEGRGWVLELGFGKNSKYNGTSGVTEGDEL